MFSPSGSRTSNQLKGELRAIPDSARRKNTSAGAPSQKSKDDTSETALRPLPASDRSRNTTVGTPQNTYPKSAAGSSFPC